MGQLDGKVALITGASKGIGRVMSRLFAQEGAAVVCAARSRDLVEETAGLVKAAGGRAVAVAGDAATEGDVKRMIETGVGAFGKLDVLINNAGDGGPTKRVQDYTSDDWFYTINSCLTSSYMCTRFAVPEMLKAGGGGRASHRAKHSRVPRGRHLRRGGSACAERRLVRERQSRAPVSRGKRKNERRRGRLQLFRLGRGDDRAARTRRVHRPA